MARLGAPSPSRDRGHEIEDLPLFLLNTVLFPGGRLPLRIFEQRYMGMAKVCLKEGSPFGVCLIREGTEVGEPAVPAGIGTLARITDWDMPQLGLLQVVARGEGRFRILERRVERDGLARARIEPIADDDDSPVPPAGARCARLLERLLNETPDALAGPHRLDSSWWVGLRLAELLPLPMESKQELLEMTDARVRLERLNALFTRAQGV
jgi:Lon protease-like protein